MIYFVGLIAIVVAFMWMRSIQEVKKLSKDADYWRNQWLETIDELSISRSERFEEWERANIAEEQIIVLKQEQADLKAAQKPEEPEEQGNFVKRHRVTKPTAETYRNVFDLDVNGIRILEHLTQVFCRDAFTDSERETCHRLGQQSVINFIVNNINRANDPNYKESVND